MHMHIHIHIYMCIYICIDMYICADIYIFVDSLEAGPLEPRRANKATDISFTSAAFAEGSAHPQFRQDRILHDLWSKLV